jgi:hypothetical protein
MVATQQPSDTQRENERAVRRENEMVMQREATQQPSGAMR